jgi:phosphoribosylformylglycinamidine cyclo-ligase
MGIGWVVIVDAAHVDTALKAGPGGHILGQMRDGEGVHVKVRA